MQPGTQLPPATSAYVSVGVFIARGKEDALVTKNLVPGESVYGEKRISIESEVFPHLYGTMDNTQGNIEPNKKLKAHLAAPHPFKGFILIFVFERHWIWYRY